MDIKATITEAIKNKTTGRIVTALAGRRGVVRGTPTAIRNDGSLVIDRLSGRSFVLVPLTAVVDFTPLR